MWFPTIFDQILYHKHLKLSKFRENFLVIHKFRQSDQSKSKTKKKYVATWTNVNEKTLMALNCL